MDVFMALLVIAASIAVSMSNSKKKKTAGKQVTAKLAQRSRPAVQKAPRNAGIPQAAASKPAQRDSWAKEEDRWEQGGGSIEMPPMEAHEHEGKPLPCPAEERERPRPRPSQMAPTEDRQPQGGLQLDFSKNQVVQAVVMAEILKRPEFKNGRRVIR